MYLGGVCSGRNQKGISGKALGEAVLNQIVVCYFTQGDYEGEANRLLRSLNRLNLQHFFQMVHGECPNWFVGVHARAHFLQGCRKTFPEYTLLSLDADCVVWKDPWTCVPSGEWDVACHTLRRPGRSDEMLPGTLMLRPTPGTDRLLNCWVNRNKVFPTSPDRQTFAFAVQQSGAVVANLPAEMCWIFDISAEAYGPLTETAIIEHLQASRRFRGLRSPRLDASVIRMKEVEKILGNSSTQLNPNRERSLVGS